MVGKNVYICSANIIYSCMQKRHRSTHSQKPHRTTPGAIRNAGLLHETRKLRLLIENIHEVIMLTGSDGRITYLSPACQSVLGYSPEDLEGKQPWIIHCEDLPQVQALHAKALKGEKGSDVQYRIVTNTGQTKWVSHSLSQGG